MQLIKNKWFQWFVILVLSFGVLPVTDASPMLVAVTMLWAIFFPTMQFTGGVFKFLKFHQFPTPFQLLRGFKRIWPAVRKGPVVTRVHRPRPSSRTP